MSITFEWDPSKARANAARHRITFPEAATVLGDPLSITIADPDHSDFEDRFATIGVSLRGRTLVVIHADRGQAIRIISARKATRKERQEYEKTTA